MKTKCTLPIIADLLFATSTDAQDRGYNNDHCGDGHANGFRQECSKGFN